MFLKNTLGLHFESTWISSIICVKTFKKTMDLPVYEVLFVLEHLGLTGDFLRVLMILNLRNFVDVKTYSLHSLVIALN